MGFGYSDIPSNGITDSFSLSFDGTGDYAGSNLATAYSGWKPAYIHANATTAFWIKMRDFSGNQGICLPTTSLALSQPWHKDMQMSKTSR
mgnify:CR=1 FL=1